jgi:CRISPR-associated protein Cmr4
MATTTINAYFIECITNMHVGSGDANYGVVDKLVQRDPVTHYPTIHASSLKGALREHFERIWVSDPDEVDNIFGKEAKGGKESESGEYKFFGADLVAIPVRSNYKQFSLTVSPELIKLTNLKCKLLTGKTIFNEINKIDFLFTNPQPKYDIYLEDEKFEWNEHTSLLKCGGINSFDDRFANAENDKFNDFAKNLPVIARNQLENGISKNLWYEEVVPHQSVFITYMSSTENHFSEFEGILIKEGQSIQIGGNASIGYGLCKFHKISFA